MSRINTNIQSLIARRVFGTNSTDLNKALGRLSTGLRINTGRDDPAGLIASETLRSSKVALTAATDNARRADTIVATAEGGLQEVNSLLLELEDLVDRSANEAGLTSSEVSANQLQIDAILQSIDRLSNSTVFGDKKLLNGTLDFSTSGIADNGGSGYDSFATSVASLEVNRAKVPNGSFQRGVVEVVTGSEFAFVSAFGNESAGTAVANGTLSAAVTIQVAGNFGVTSLSFASGATQQQIVDAVNGSTALTGVSAILSSNSGGINAVVFSANTFGSKGFVDIDIVNTTGTTGLDFGGLSGRDEGVDGTVLVNGTAAIVDGLKVSTRSNSLDVDLVLGQTFGTTDGGQTEFSVTGGGAKFNIAPEVGLVGLEAIGIKSVASSSLGNSDTGFLSTLGSGQTNGLSSGNFSAAQRVVRAAIDQVSSLRGRLGAFQKNTLDSSINSMLVTFENISAAESAIRDADFAVETSNLTRSQILVNSATSTLQLANSLPQNVLSLLG
jgi:flagellin